MHRHADAGHLVVTPIRRIAARTRAVTPDGPPAGSRRRSSASAGSPWRPIDRSRRSSARRRSACGGRSTRRCPSPTTSTRRSSSSRGCRGRSPARWSAARWRPPASSSRACCAIPLATPFTLGVSAGAALGAMLAITFGWSLAQARAARRSGRELRRLARRGRHRLRAGARAAPRHLDQHAAARRRDDERVLLGADPVRAVFRRLRRDLSDAALADGRPRRQRATSRS